MTAALGGYRGAGEGGGDVLVPLRVIEELFEAEAPAEQAHKGGAALQGLWSLGAIAIHILGVCDAEQTCMPDFMIDFENQRADGVAIKLLRKAFCLCYCTYLRDALGRK